MILDSYQSKNVIIESTEDLVRFLSSNKHVGELILEVVKLIKIALTIPISNPTELSFSAWTRLKLNRATPWLKENWMTLHAKKLNLETVVNIFIKRSTKRRNIFFKSENWKRLIFELVFVLWGQNRDYTIFICLASLILIHIYCMWNFTFLTFFIICLH